MLLIYTLNRLTCITKCKGYQIPAHTQTSGLAGGTALKFPALEHAQPTKFNERIADKKQNFGSAQHRSQHVNQCLTSVEHLEN